MKETLRIFNITPCASYVIQDVFVDGVSQGAISEYQFAPVHKNHNVSASFIPQYTINATAGTGGTISPNGSVNVSEGADQIFNITPNTSYEINQTLVDDIAVTLSDNTYTFENVTANHTISVTFNLIQPTLHTITATAGTGGTISPNGSVEVNDGADQTFTITANLDYEINQTLVDGEHVILVNNAYTFENVTANHTISVTFNLIQPTLHTITATAGTGGTISPNGSVEVNEGADQTFTITANLDYEINQTLVDGEPVILVNNAYTFEDVTADHTISVTFNLIQPTLHTITATAGTGGTISPNGSVEVNEGADQTFTITANLDYEINQTLVDGEPVILVNNAYTFEDVTADHTISVTFNLIQPTPHTITATAGTGGTISPSGSVQVNEGDTPTFTVTANSGYTIQDVLVDGVSIGPVSSYQFAPVTADHTIFAGFNSTSVNVGYYLIHSADGNQVYFDNEFKGTVSNGVLNVIIDRNAEPFHNFTLKKPGFYDRTAALIQQPRQNETVDLYQVLVPTIFVQFNETFYEFWRFFHI